MAKFSIYSQDGGTIRFSGEPKYNGSYLKVSYIEFSEIRSATPIGWEIGDYLDYSRTGLRYKLYSIPQPKKQARRDTSGEAFVYSNVQLHCATKQLEIALFNDSVLDAEKNLHFSTRESFSTYEDVYGIARRIQASIDSFFPDKWVIKVMDLDEEKDKELIETLSEAKEFASTSGTCLGALNNIYNTWEGIGWAHTYDTTLGKDVITIGRPNKREDANTTSVFQYGLGKGLTAIKKSFSNQDDFATRLYVYGSDRNLPGRYYNGKEICNAKSVDIVNLMLPLSSWGTATDPDTGETLPDASLAYIQDDAVVAKYGLIPKKVYFNGSDNDEVYPSVKNLTAGKLRAIKAEQGDTSYVPSTEIYPDGEALDVIKAATNPTDSGIISEDASSILFEDTVAVDIPAGTGYMGNSEKDRDTRPETYQKPIEIPILKYAPAGTATRVIIEPDLTFKYNEKDTHAKYADAVTLSQITRVTVRRTDGTMFSMDDQRTVLDAVPAKSAPTQQSVKLQNEYIIATGTIVSIEFLIEISRTLDVACGIYVNNDEFSGSIYLGFKESVSDTFNLVLKQIGFNLADCVSTASSGIATISMKDGMCGGRDFAVTRCSYRSDTDDWELVMKRAQDDSVGMRYPNASFPIAAGDKFVILDIEMPEIYVLVAEQALLDAATNLYTSASKGLAYYEPEIDAKALATSGEALKEGMYMQLRDDEVVENGTDYILIDTLTINEGESNIPTYKITLREKKSQSYAEVQAAALSNLSMRIEASKGGPGVDIITTGDSSESTDSNVYSSLRADSSFLSKINDDTAGGLLTLLEGLKVGNYIAGVEGAGGYIDANGNAVFDSLTLRRFLEVPELRYNRISINVGNSWRAPGGGVIEKVVPDYDADGNLLNTGIVYLHLEDGEPGRIALDDICMGIYHDGIDLSNNSAVDTDDSIGNFRFTGFFTAYFRVTEVLASDNSCFRYSIRPTSTEWPETMHPVEAMHFVVYGNFSDTDRQSSRYSTRTYERYLKGVASWEFTSEDNIAAQFGDLSNLSAFGLQMSGYSAYLNNIYMSGTIKQFLAYPLRIEIDNNGMDAMAYGETMDIKCTVYKGWDDMTDKVVTWKIVRDTGNPTEDAAWALTDKAKNFAGSITIEHTESYSDLGTIGVSTLFTITATLADSQTANFSLTI